MKTIFDKRPLLIKAGETTTFDLPEPYRTSDSLFLLVHNAFSEKLTVSLSNGNGEQVSKAFTLASFPAVIVFTASRQTEDDRATDIANTTVSFSSFHDFEGSLTYRVRNPASVIAAYQDL